MRATATAIVRTPDLATGADVRVDGGPDGIFIEDAPVHVEDAPDGDVFLSGQGVRVKVSADTFAWLRGDPNHGRMRNRLTQPQEKRQVQPAPTPPVREEKPAPTWPPDEAYGERETPPALTQTPDECFLC